MSRLGAKEGDSLSWWISLIARVLSNFIHKNLFDEEFY